MNVVAIDFSINSPGICVLKNDKPFFISFIKPKLGTKAQLAIKDQLAELDDVYILDQEEPNIERQELSRVQRHIHIADNLISMIEEHTDPSQPYRIYFEGASYGTSRFGTNSLIDLSSAASIMKAKMIERWNVEAMDVLAPTTIKKFAGKGNMKKEQMWEVFLDNQSLRESPFWNFCQSLREDKKLAKPIDDLVDSYFILMCALGA